MLSAPRMLHLIFIASIALATQSSRLWSGDQTLAWANGIGGNAWQHPFPTELDRQAHLQRRSEQDEKEMGNQKFQTAGFSTAVRGSPRRQILRPRMQPTQESQDSLSKTKRKKQKQKKKQTTEHIHESFRKDLRKHEAPFQEESPQKGARSVSRQGSPVLSEENIGISETRKAEKEKQRKEIQRKTEGRQAEFERDVGRFKNKKQDITHQIARLQLEGSPEHSPRRSKTNIKPETDSQSSKGLGESNKEFKGEPLRSLQ